MAAINTEHLDRMLERIGYEIVEQNHMTDVINDLHDALIEIRNLLVELSS